MSLKTQKTRIKIWGVRDAQIAFALLTAEQRHIFADNNLLVEWKLFDSGIALTDEIRRTPADERPFAFVQTPLTAALLEQREILVSLLFPFATIEANQHCVVNDTIWVPEDLKGKRIGMVKGSAIYIPLHTICKTHKIPLNSFKIVDLPPKQQLEQFLSGDLDGIACWPDHSLKALENGGHLLFTGDRTFFNGQCEWDKLLILETFLSTFPENIEKNRSTVLALIRAFKQATEDINQHSAQLVEELAPILTMDEKDLSIAISGIVHSAVLDEISVTGVEQLFDYAKAPRHPHEVLNTEILKEASSGIVTLVNGPTLEVFPEDPINFREDWNFEASVPLTFLIVDDNQMQQELIASMIKEFLPSAQIVGRVKDGLQAVEFCRFQHPTFITMDLGMKNMDGYTCLKVISNGVRPCPIAISAYESIKARQQALACGARVFIGKSYLYDGFEALAKKIKAKMEI